MKRIRILMADDHPMFRFGLRTLLQTEPDMEVIAEATTGEEVMSLAITHEPDVILMDLNMPGINGIDATRRIIQAKPHIAILVITMFDDDSVFAAMRAGARGYILKGVEGDETLRAIKAVAKGEAIFSPTVAQRLIHYFAKGSPKGESATFPELTDREQEVLGLIAKGLTNSAIAERLLLSPKTIRNLVSSIFSKLQVAGRAEAIIRARNAGLG